MPRWLAIPGSSYRSVSRRFGSWLLPALLAVGCATTPTPPVAPAVTSTRSEPVSGGWLDTSPLPAVLRLPIYPADRQQLATTSAAIYQSNLDARIDQLEQAQAAQPRSDLAHALALSLGHRFRILGRLDDSTRAGKVIADQLVLDPGHAPLRLARAGWLSQFHRFALAQQILEELGSQAPLAAPVAALEAEIELALGRYQKLGTAFWKPEQPGPPDIYAVAARANAAVLHGDLDLASRLYFEAQSLYRDVGPFPLAWLHTQQGIALLRFGHFAQAARFFTAAHERLPQYYLATEHLAECLVQLGDLTGARELYVEVIAQTGNPEFMAALAMLERELGNEESGQQWQRQADLGYRALLTDFPDAYAQHAAEFYLEIGDISRATELAQQNLDIRTDVSSRLLRAEVALAAIDRSTACQQMALIQATGLNPPEVKQLAARLNCT